MNKNRIKWFLMGGIVTSVVVGYIGIKIYRKRVADVCNEKEKLKQRDDESNMIYHLVIEKELENKLVDYCKQNSIQKVVLIGNNRVGSIVHTFLARKGIEVLYFIGESDSKQYDCLPLEQDYVDGRDEDLLIVVNSEDYIDELEKYSSKCKTKIVALEDMLH